MRAPHERNPARRGGTCRHRSPSTGRRPRKRWAFAGRRAIRWTASPTAISRSNTWRSPPSAPRICRGWRRNGDLVEPQFGFVTLSDQLFDRLFHHAAETNPDAAELTRGKTGRIYGALVGLLTTMKGLPLTYSKDMQEDKEPVFDAAENLPVRQAMTGMVRDMQSTPIRCCAPPAPAIPPPPTWRTGWCARSIFRSAMPTISPDAL